MDHYKEAARLGLRFRFNGTVPVESLFKLSLSELNQIYINLEGQKEKPTGLMKPANANAELDLSLWIVRDVYETLDAERKAKAEAAAQLANNKAKKEQLLRVLAEKQQAVYAGLSPEELVKLISEL